MSRPLTPLLDKAMLDQRRQPAWRVLIYDLRSGLNTIRDIITGALLHTTTGPRDFTGDVASLTIEEVAGDFNGDGVAASTLSLTVLDPYGIFDPMLVQVDPTGDGRWFRAGNVIRVLEGDARVDPSEWPLTFTGILSGQAGVSRSRVLRVAELTMDAVDRVPGFLRTPVTTSNFGQGVSYRTIAETIAEEDMGLDLDEIDFATWGTETTGHVSTQFAEELPLVAIAQLMFPGGFMPKFTGEGKLSQSSGVITKSPARIYTNDDLFQAILRPKHNAKTKNRVTVRGLSATMTKITQPEQALAEVQITTGFFAQNEEIPVTWSEDETQLAQNTRMDVLRGINGGLTAFSGGGEEYTETPLLPEGSRGGVITVDTGFAPYIVVFLTGVYVALEAIPEEVIVAAFGAGGGFTIPLTKSVPSAAALSAALMLMTQIGRGHYVIRGEPFEYVFQEIVGTAEIDGLVEADANVLDIQNHLIQTQAQADTAARDVLFREVAKGNMRRVLMLHDLRLEPDDVFQTSDDRKYMIQRVSRTLRRETGAVLAELECFEVTPGVLP